MKMNLLNSAYLFNNADRYIDNVARRVSNSFRYKGYEVNEVKLPTGEWDISLKKGNLFQAVLGMQTALKVRLSASTPHALVKMNIGLFGQQAIPTILTIAVWWPIALCQIAGLVKQHKLDQEVVAVIAKSFNMAAGHTITYSVID